MRHRRVIAAAIVLGVGGFGTAIAQAPSPAAPGTATPPELMRGTTTMNNPATATTPAPGSSAATMTPSAPSPGLGTAPTTSGANNRPSADATSPASGNNAVNLSSTSSTTPVSGANSFTEGQARSRMEDNGFTQVTDLKLDNEGVWRATASKDGKQVAVALDYQGNVVAR